MSDTRSGKTRILIVDDHPANRLAFGTVLETAGYDVQTAASGEEALRHVTHEEFGVILLDVRMPGMDGFEVASHLRQLDRTRDTPIIFMSAYDRTPMQISRGYQAGATDYLFSPIDEDVLTAKVTAYFKLHLKHRRLKEQVGQLTGTVQSLQAEVSLLRPAQEGLKEKLQELNRVIASLRKEIDAGALT